MDVKGKNVVVIGMARSGAASAVLLAQKGARVTVNDRRTLEEMRQETGAFAAYPQIRVIGGGHPEEIVDRGVDLVVKNPGVPLHLPPLKKAMDLGIPVITEVELAYWYLAAPMVCITGTNGKTTTTSLVGEIYKATGRKTFVAGNIGIPLSAVVTEAGEQDVVVAELSSFQLEGILRFRPKLSAILNITPDHMDRHGSMEAYIEAKARIFANQGAEDATVLNADDPEAYGLRGRPACPVYLFSRKREVDSGAFVREDKVIMRYGGREESICRVGDIAIPGNHNLENALAAVLLARLGGVPVEIVARTLKHFPGVAHRLERAGRVAGIDFINDSKGTNSDAAIKALEAFARPIVLIAGGYDKGGTFEELAQAVKQHARHTVLIGQVARRMAEAFDKAGYNSYDFAATLEDAVQTAFQAAASGDVVLLSPACASWDMFRDYEERGERFKEAVRELGGRVNGEVNSG